MRVRGVWAAEFSWFGAFFYHGAVCLSDTLGI